MLFPFKKIRVQWGPCWLKPCYPGTHCIYKTFIEEISREIADAQKHKPNCEVSWQNHAYLLKDWLRPHNRKLFDMYSFLSAPKVMQTTKEPRLELVSEELNHFGLIAGLFWKIRGHTGWFVLFALFEDFSLKLWLKV